MNGGTLRILHVITGLATGGAEISLLRLVSAGRADGVESAVISLTSLGPVGERIANLGIPVTVAGIGRNPLGLARLLRLRRPARRFAPHLIQGWMYHGNLAASFLAFRAAHRAPVLWNIRQTLYRLADEKTVTAAVVRIGAALSRRPAAIVYNSEISAGQHEAIGYAAAKRVVIPNGIDCMEFVPSPDARAALRGELGLGANALLVGLVARLHPMKDHRGFLLAAGQLAPLYPDLHFVLAGRGVTPDEPSLARIIAEQNLAGRVHLLDERSDIARIDAALDIACSSSSRAEGFSNAIAEAMACGVPCVVTEVGEGRGIVGDTGVAVPPLDPGALAESIKKLLDAGSEARGRLGAAARRRVETEFSLAKTVRAYHALYRAKLAEAQR